MPSRCQVRSGSDARSYSPVRLVPALRRFAVIVAAGLLGGSAYFLHWGVVQISLANLVVIVAMLAVFALALVLPFPGGRYDADSEVSDGRK